ncbi:MAG: hypothetical protein R3E97_14460 [Candidatus Eisenbacteria bacterium]
MPSSSQCRFRDAALNGWVLYGKTLPHVIQFSRRLEASMGRSRSGCAEHAAAVRRRSRRRTSDSSYRSGRRIVDLSGITTPEMLEVHDKRRGLQIDLGFAPLAQPDYLIDRATQPRRVLSNRSAWGAARKRCW